MRMSSDNNFLFTTSKDGTLMMHEIRVPRGFLNKDKDFNALPYSNEILTEKSEIEEDKNMLEALNNELAGAKDPNYTGVENEIGQDA